ncbi:MAG: hypothetical protein Q9222_004412 [Ikaeria aurantiellina]
MAADLTPDNISTSDIRHHLERYKCIIPTELCALSELRYNEIPQILLKRKDDENEEPFLEKAEVQQLVEWKLASRCHCVTQLSLPAQQLKHGTFRPTLTRLVASNSSATVYITTRNSFIPYSLDESRHPSLPIANLTRLKGIGPATASLLLSCYDPTNVPFFSDELYRWLHDSAEPTRQEEGEKTKKRKLSTRKPKRISYTIKEYIFIFDRVTALRSRLDASSDGGEPVKAVDVERAAYSIMKARQEEGTTVDTAEDPGTGETKAPALKRRKRKRAA